MRNLGLCILFFVAAFTVYACSTANKGNLPIPNNNNRETFSIEVVGGLGTFTPELVVEETASGVAVTVMATEAEELAAANFNLHYDNKKYSPERVEFTGLFGVKEQLLSLAILDGVGHVAVGVAQIHDRGGIPVNGSGVLATVFFSNGIAPSLREAAAAPSSNANAVSDLMITGQTADSVSLRWTEVNIGDYNNNSEVEIADLTPIAILYGSDNSTPYGKLVDGDGNGEINLADIAEIAKNYGNSIRGYTVYTNGAGTENIGSGRTCDRSNFFVDDKTPVVYTHACPFNPALPATFTVRPVITAEASSPGILSNIAESINDEGPPEAPTGLFASSGDTTGHAKILLGWTKSTFTNMYDVAAYEIQSGVSGSGTWDPVTEVGGEFNSFMDSELEDQEYDYRARARDFTDLTSDWSETASATPWFMAPPDPPINLSAVPHATQSLAVRLEWDAPLVGNVVRYLIFGQEQGGAGFEQIGATPFASIEYLSHTDLVFGTTYEYYVVTVGDGNVESDPSEIVSSMCSEEGDIVITSLTNDKTTHHEDGGEADSNLVVIADPAPDSVSWVASYGTINGSGTNVTWSCPAGSSPQVVTITCTVHKGSGQDSRNLELYITEETIKTTYNIIAPGTLCGGTGRFIDFTRPMVEQPNEPYKSLSDFIDGSHVVTYNLWEIWCPPCRGEMPEMYEWAVAYEDYDYYHVGHSSSYPLHTGSPNVTDWLQGGSPAPPVDTRPWDKFHMFNKGISDPFSQWGGDPVWTQFFSGYGSDGKSLPRSILFDKDGYARLASSTLGGASAAHWEDIIKQLTGAP